MWYNFSISLHTIKMTTAYQVVFELILWPLGQKFDTSKGGEDSIAQTALRSWIESVDFQHMLFCGAVNKC